MSHTLPYTEAESDTAHREWKASCGHHCCAVFANASLSAVKYSGIKLNGWMNPSMISICLRGLKTEFLYHPFTTPQSPETILSHNAGGNRILRVQFLGPWMKGPVVRQYQHTHYIATSVGCVMDPLFDCQTLLRPEDWLVWAARSYLEHHEKCTGFHFTHLWRSTANRPLQPAQEPT